MRSAKKEICNILALLCCSVLFLTACGKKQGNQDVKADGVESAVMVKKTDVKGVKLSFRVDRAFMGYKYIQIDISENGEADMQYKRYYKEENKPEDNLSALKTFAVDKVKLAGLIELHKKIDFFNLKIKDMNKNQETVTDVGTTTLIYCSDGQEGSISYGYAENKELDEIVSLYWEIIKSKLPEIKQ